MTKLILISHGKLSEGMAYSAQMIAGENENLSYYGLMPGGDVEKDIMTKRWKATVLKPAATPCAAKYREQARACSSSVTPTPACIFPMCVCLR